MSDGYFSALFEPILYWLLAYDESGGGTKRELLCGLFGVQGGDWWDKLEESERALVARLAGFGENPPPFERVCGSFRLSPFERFTLSLALAREFDSRFDAAVRLLGGPLTLDFALRVFCGGLDEALTLRADWFKREKELALLIRASADAISEPLVIRGCVLRYILGLDFGIDGAELYLPSAEASGGTEDRGFAEAASRVISAKDGGRIVLLSGPEGAGKKRRVRCFSNYSGQPVLFAHSVAAERTGDVLAALVLSGAYLCVTDFSQVKDVEALVKAALGISGCVFLTGGPDRPNLSGFDIAEFKLDTPGVTRRRELWRGFLRARGYDENLAFAVADKYAFTPGVIEKALRSAEMLMRLQDSGELSERLLDEGCVLCLPESLSGLMREVEAVFCWDDLVLPKAQKRALAEACSRVKYAAAVYEDWGLGAKLPYGRGMRALFSGPPGTGKTMAAQVMASELQMKLYRVDLSALVSKYIGETEKNLASLFEDAKRAGGILFFDEADALFGKRVGQSDSHDRFANMQTAYLLQAIENYEGVLILATNLAENIDEAFARRIQCRVDFTPPDEEARHGIWSRLLNGSVPLEAGIDIDFLARSFELTGAEIKNIVITAAFLAASRGKGMGMRELCEATCGEYAKTGRILSSGELGQYEGLG